ncbi:hypothetical protein [Aerosakkonema funiforme]
MVVNGLTIVRTTSGSRMRSQPIHLVLDRYAILVKARIGQITE